MPLDEEPVGIGLAADQRDDRPLATRQRLPPGFDRLLVAKMHNRINVQAGFDGGRRQPLVDAANDRTIGAEVVGDAGGAGGDDEDGVLMLERQLRLQPGRGLVGAEAEDDAAGELVQLVAFTGWSGHRRNHWRYRGFFEHRTDLIDRRDGKADGDAGEAVDGLRHRRDRLRA